MGKMSRTKGHTFERHVAATLRGLYPDARRGLAQARAGHETSDVEGTPFRIECKHGQAPSLFAALAQAERDGTTAKDPRPVLVVARRNGGSDVAVLHLSDLLELLGRVAAAAPAEAPTAQPASEQ